MRAIWAWPELNPGAEVAQDKAKVHWRKARKTLSVAAVQARSLRSDEAFDAFNRALQQRYARSSFGFDALLLRRAWRAWRACAWRAWRAWRACMFTSASAHCAGTPTLLSGRVAAGAPRCWTRSWW